MSNIFLDLELRAEAFLKSGSKSKSHIEEGKKILEDIRLAGRLLINISQRQQFSNLARDVGDKLWELTGKYYLIHLLPIEDKNLQEYVENLPKLHKFQDNESSKYVLACPPPMSTTLVGRDIIIDDITNNLIISKRNVGIFGIGGIGKTDLLRTIGCNSSIHNYFPDGVFYVELGTTPDIGSIIYTWLRLLNVDVVNPNDIDFLINKLRIHLYPLSCLIILDDIWDDSLKSAITLRDCAGPQSLLLSSSRSHDIIQEVVPNGIIITLDLLDTDSALKLLYSDAEEQVKNEPYEARLLVEALGRLPLALKLAGAYLRNDRRHDKPCAELLKTWHNRLDQLRGYEPRPGLSEVSPSLYSIIKLSFDALPDSTIQEAALSLGAFGIAPVTWDWDAMTSVWAVDDNIAEHSEKQLVRSGLLMFDYKSRRYSIHSTIAAFLAQSVKDEHKNRHAMYYADFSQAFTNDDIIDNPERFINNISLEHINIITALDWAIESKSYEIMLKIGSKVLKYWALTNLFPEYSKRITKMLEYSRDYPYLELERAEILSDFSNMLLDQGNIQQSFLYQEESLDIRRSNGNELDISRSMNNLARISHAKGEYSHAISLYQQALGYFEKTQDEYRKSIVYVNIGRSDLELGNIDSALNKYMQSLTFFRSISNDIESANVLIDISIVFIIKNDLNEAFNLLKESLEVFIKSGNEWKKAIILSYMGWIELCQGNLDIASHNIKQSLITFHNFDDKTGSIACIEDIASVELARGKLERAALLFGAANKLGRSLNQQRLLISKNLYDKNIQELRTLLDPMILDKAWSAGQSLSFNAAVEAALAVT